MPKSQHFQTRFDLFHQKAHWFQKRYKLLAGLRTLVFISGLILVVYFGNLREPSAIFFTALISVSLFSTLVYFHNKVKYNKNQNEFLATLNKQEIHRLEGILDGFETGKEFIDEDHPYTSDLDIFGQNSLYQLLNRTSTDAGRKTLANWLQGPATQEVIQERQEAISEIAADLDWRQNLQASTMHFSDLKSDFKEFEKWLKEPPKFSDNPAYRLMAFVLPAISIASLILVFTSDLAYQFFLISIVLNATLLSKAFGPASEVADKAAKSLYNLQAFKVLIEMIESRTFESSLLKKLQSDLEDVGIKASTEIHNLVRIMNRFDSRANIIFIFLDLIFLLDFHWLINAENWKSRNREHIHKWTDAISGIEALSSLAGTLHTHEEFNLPEVTESYDLELIGIGHPLINARERICNDFVMKGKGQEVIITGSNMSGKSTFLRTLGINMILALAGGPVSADKARIPVVTLFTSMRTHDDLKEHISSFYAELRRIKGLLAIFDKSKIPVFYLLDEILKGTNSKDRHLGAESLMIQLKEKNGMGLISTHDIALGNLEVKIKNLKNYSFNSTIEGDEIKFDYRINDGVCKSFNASKLMEKMGIAIPVRK